MGDFGIQLIERFSVSSKSPLSAKTIGRAWANCCSAALPYNTLSVSEASNIWSARLVLRSVSSGWHRSNLTSQDRDVFNQAAISRTREKVRHDSQATPAWKYLISGSSDSGVVHLLRPRLVVWCVFVFKRRRDLSDRHRCPSGSDTWQAKSSAVSLFVVPVVRGISSSRSDFIVQPSEPSHFEQLLRR